MNLTLSYRRYGQWLHEHGLLRALARHKTMENYIAAKERIFENQLSTDYLVLNIDDPVVADMEHRAPSHILKISQKKAVENGAYYADGQCYIAKDGVAKFVIADESVTFVANCCQAFVSLVKLASRP